ncbi:hypothetical protein AXX17_AT3G35680 [Arabidopsis thaliana]|uniref:Uncharacterized protein n=1 Tax=Arabidopsis thaliana TaxID=3702 RepID=A0A178VHG1_ARATH|nr:hypothetical protein AXX17_AT3G35680 [Arabidopsis thaliana]
MESTLVKAKSIDYSGCRLKSKRCPKRLCNGPSEHHLSNQKEVRSSDTPLATLNSKIGTLGDNIGSQDRKLEAVERQLICASVPEPCDRSIRPEIRENLLKNVEMPLFEGSAIWLSGEMRRIRRRFERSTSLVESVARDRVLGRVEDRVVSAASSIAAWIE